ncbi:hypothetical protein LCGC14_1232390 [marine sediment metagenome]|uniref:Uncharacterized protein n=1 Tax=marine sediment metagenome TaxID=412755 RepID=A0A0F9LC72_9ZZZZ
MTEPRRHGRQSRGHIHRGRTIPLPGDGDEDGNWFICWSCGMHCNDVTDELDDGASKVHTSHQDYAIQALGGFGIDAKVILRFEYTSANIPLGTLSVARADSNGNAQEVVHNYKIVDTKGCPNDGNLNWKGDH